MVSTRGVKFKFSEGEKVLCYEPDPTKAKVLYDSKVLELVVSRDSRGRKVPEYLIHFSGWNSSWDRCVKEEFILPDTEENRNLQTKLAKEAALCLKGKRKLKLPPIIKETLVKKECMEDSKGSTVTADIPTEESTCESESTDCDVTGTQSPLSHLVTIASTPPYQCDVNCEYSSKSQEEMEQTIEIEIPSVLKEQLEEDWYYITQKDKIIKIPCETNVVTILEAYEKHVALEMMCAASRNCAKTGKEFLPLLLEPKLDICKEVMDGIRIYFDFTLPHLLLYCQEKKQYYTVGNDCAPLNVKKRENTKGKQKVGTTKTEHEMSSNAIPMQREQQKSAPVHTSTRGGLRNQKLASPVVEEMNGTSGCTIKPKGLGQGQIPKDMPGPSTRGRKPRATGPKRILRSNDKQKTLDDGTNNVLAASSITSGPENDVSPTRPESPTTPTSPSRQIRKSLQSTPPAPTSGQNNRSPPGQRRMVNVNAVNNITSQSTVNVQMPLTISVCRGSWSGSSTHSSLSSPMTEREQFCHLEETQDVLTLLSWKILPSYIYEESPAAPSLIYGAQHLLRLFVKLPELVYKMNMPQRKLTPLLDNLNSFLQWLSEKKDEYFLPSAYIDCCNDFLDNNTNAFT